jgi:hypothetical protein
MKPKTILILGDTFTLAIFNFVGFAFHGETDISFLPRMAAVFFPVLVSWFVLVPWFGLLDEQLASQPKSLWRVPLAMLFAAPLAVIFRSAILETPALPLFTLILGVTNAFGMLIWRGVYAKYQ